MNDDEDALPRPFQAATLASSLERLEVLYRETGNPVFVWKALAAQRAPRLYAKHTEGAIPPLQIPEWAAEYLLVIASRLSGLANGVRVIRSKGELSLLSIVQDDATESMKDVTAVLLGLTSQGGNAFKKYQATILEEWTATRIKQLQVSGLSREEAMAQIKLESGHVETSVIAKRVARGNRFLDQIRALRLRTTVIH